MLPPETRNIVMPRKFITNIIINYIWNSWKYAMVILPKT